MGFPYRKSKVLVRFSPDRSRLQSDAKHKRSINVYRRLATDAVRDGDLANCTRDAVKIPRGTLLPFFPANNFWGVPIQKGDAEVGRGRGRGDDGVKVVVVVVAAVAEGRRPKDMCNEAGPKVVHCSTSESHLTTALKR
ncbi:hypothetical protein QTP88_006659 [Uroleucon formosanum]